MVDLIQRYRIFILIAASALILLGIAVEAAGNEGEGLLLFISPGVLLALIVYLTSKHGQSFLSRSDANQKGGSADELLKWHQLKEKGVISDAEFEERKKKLLG